VEVASGRLDLRRPEMARNLRVRSKVATATRVFMDEQGFLEVETPTLFKSTPEGAREFLVPCRTNPGLFYALPQSPQQFKQILMVAGVEKYFQLARCYRDEDLRADRQPEFTQIDIEMSFIEREDIYALIEGLLQRVWKTALNIDVPVPFKRLTFEEALNRYGIDKPDTRFAMELVDFTGEFKTSTFKVFSGAIAKGGVVKALIADGALVHVHSEDWLADPEKWEKTPFLVADDPQCPALAPEHAQRHAVAVPPHLRIVGDVVPLARQ